MSGHAIHIKVDGRTYSGTFKVDRKTLTVTTTYGRKSAEVGPRVTHQSLAHQLLQELVAGGKVSQGLDALRKGGCRDVAHCPRNYCRHRHSGADGGV